MLWGVYVHCLVIEKKEFSHWYLISQLFCVSSVVSAEDKYIKITNYSPSIKLVTLVIKLRLKNQMLYSFIPVGWVTLGVLSLMHWPLNSNLVEQKFYCCMRNFLGNWRITSFLACGMLPTPRKKNLPTTFFLYGNRRAGEHSWLEWYLFIIEGFHAFV